MSNERSGDLVLPQGTYAMIQDNSSGNVEVIVGPSKVSLAESDKPVIYDPFTRSFEEVTRNSVIQVSPEATEGQYMVLTNPVKEDASKRPSKGKQQALILKYGNKINIPGPVTFPLFPAQHAEVINGHQLKSNEYLVVRVYNDDAAKENLGKTILKTVDTDEKATKKEKTLITKDDLFTGNLIIIKGTNASFFIPPTGIEVMRDEDGNYTRDAVTLERLEYCILLDQNGDKRYVQGPAVVFPEPTEEFVETNNNKKFKAIELNENMGLYIKVIADYKDGNKLNNAGDELFITGDETKIYFPRPEHAIIKYGKRTLHYAVAIPNGEARYVLDKTTGKVELVKGPKMFMPDPRNQVIVKRVLDPKKVELMFPGNPEALNYNQNLGQSDEMNLGFVEEGLANFRTMASTKTRGDIHTVGDELYRSSKYTKPRTIQLDSKYEGAVTVDIWPGFAIQIVKRTGERRVVNGPSTVLLEFDEILESLSLSTGKPKSDNHQLKTVYLQTQNNTVSDIVEAETKDMVNVAVTLSYRVNFLKEHQENWFGVQDYVKLLTQHLRSIVRNFIKKMTIQDLNENFTDLIRNIILGSASEADGRKGKLFTENGMHIYDVEVLNLQIGDSDIDNLLKKAERETVRQNLSLIQNQKNLEFNKQIEEMEREESEEKRKTEMLEHEQNMDRLDEKKAEEKFELEAEQEEQSILDDLNSKKLARKKMEGDQRLEYDDAKADIEIKLVKDKLNAVNPKLSEALISMGNQHVMEVLAQNIKAQGGGLSNLFVKGGFAEIMEAVKGTPIEEQFNKFFTDLKKKSK